MKSIERTHFVNPEYANSTKTENQSRNKIKNKDKTTHLAAIR